MVSDGAGNLYVTENSIAVGSHVIRKITINALAPLANFESTKTSLKVNEETTLTDISGGEEATSRTWTISPANYTINEGSLTSKELKLEFTSTGFYEVRLAITNTFGSDTKIGQNFFAVSTTGTGSVTAYSDNPLMQVYPNPANENITIALDPSLDLSQGKLALYAADGSKVIDVNIASTLDASELSNGTYYLTFTSEDHKIIKRLIIAHK